MTDEELQEMIEEADRDGDGEVNVSFQLNLELLLTAKISFQKEEFLRIMQKTQLY